MFHYYNLDRVRNHNKKLKNYFQYLLNNNALVQAKKRWKEKSFDNQNGRYMILTTTPFSIDDM